MTDAVIERVKERSHWGQLPCIAAHAAAWEMGVSPARIGAIADELGLVISHCQLGLFGYGSKAEGKSKLIRPMPAIHPELEANILAKAKEGRISCRACWDIAAEMGIERLVVGNTADAMGLRIGPCQLGAF